ncbi:hypothetical protein NL492_26850, partial [Klebsiella pneumoniae]|nr:hypothetical protein [Klebsiella pneumoniae]
DYLPNNYAKEQRDTKIQNGSVSLHRRLPVQMRNFNDSSKGEMDGAIPLTRLSHSVPGSPVEDRLNAAGVIGSAESLVGRILAEQG